MTETTLHVALDARCLNTAHVRGMGKYLNELMSHAMEFAPMRWSCAGDRPDISWQLPQIPDCHGHTFECRGYRFHTWEQLALPRFAKRIGADLLHATMTTLPYWQPIPTIVTLHDTLPWQEARLDAFESWYRRKLQVAALRRATCIITISDCSRRDIIREWPDLESKLEVIPHGVTQHYLDVADVPRPATVRKLVDQRRYLLYVGGSARHKRFEWALEVLSELRPLQLDMLILGFSSQEAELQRSRLPDGLASRVHFLPFVAEAEMPQIYRHAVAVLYPTRYEGFGFPAIEAQAVGTPVLFSAVGSLAELTGPLAEVVPSDDLDAWTSTLRKIHNQRVDGSPPDVQARSWAGSYSWSRSANRHLSVYQRGMAEFRSGESTDTVSEKTA